MATSPVRLSADDVFELDVPEHLRGYELVDGELVEIAMPGAPHGRILARLAQRLLNHIDDHGIDGTVYSDSGYVLGLHRDPERLRLPDISYVSDATLEAAGGEPARGWFRLIADLVIEIDSPGRRPVIERARIRDYKDWGVALIWVIHTESKRATVCHADGSVEEIGPSDVLDGGAVLPGLRLPVSDVFR